MAFKAADISETEMLKMVLVPYSWREEIIWSDQQTAKVIDKGTVV